MDVIATPGNPKANSYISLERADSSFVSLVPGWDSMSELEKSNILKLSAADINRLRFLGLPFYKNQMCAFPRKGNLFAGQAVFSTDTVEEPDSVIVPSVVASSDPMPDIMVGGSVIIFYEDGTVSYHDIVASNGVTGEVKFSPEKEDKDILKANVHQPIFPEVIAAQTVQALIRSGADPTYDPNVGKGILKIRIHDSERQYADMTRSNTTSRLATLAARNNISEQVLALIGHLTVYGKVAVVSQVEYEDMVSILTGRNVG